MSECLILLVKDNRMRSEGMRRLFIFISLFIGTFFMVSCRNDENVSDLEPTDYLEVNQLDGVTMLAQEESITPTGLTLFFENETNTEFTYGQAYLLEVNIDGEWYQVPIATDENYAFEDIGYILPANGTAELTVEWEWLFEELNPGEYRIVKDVLDVKEPGEYETYPLTAEFTIE